MESVTKLLKPNAFMEPIDSKRRTFLLPLHPAPYFSDGYVPEMKIITKITKVLF